MREVRDVGDVVVVVVVVTTWGRLATEPIAAIWGVRRPGMIMPGTPW